jgi:hypothetical protein
LQLYGRGGGRHDVIHLAVWNVAGAVNGGHVERGTVAAVLEPIVRAHAPDRLSDYHRSLRRCLDRAPARHPASGGVARMAMHDGERAADVYDWLDRRVLADRAVTVGGVVGANALAVLVVLAATAATVGTTDLHETDRELAHAAGMTRQAVQRSRPLWLRHVAWVEKGTPAWRTRRGIERPGTRSIYRLLPATTEAYPNPGLSRGRCGPSGLGPLLDRRPGDGRVHVDLNDPWHLPGAQRWRGRSGRRGEWRVWLALDVDEGLSISDVARVTGFKWETAKKYLARMAVAGEARRDGDALWTRVVGDSIYDEARSSLYALTSHLVPVTHHSLLDNLVVLHRRDVLALDRELAA